MSDNKNVAYKIKDALPFSFNQQLAEARKRLAAGKKIKQPQGVHYDKKGNLFVDIATWREKLKQKEIRAAIQHHNNDIDFRLDEGGFPKDKQDRYFAATYNFGNRLIEAQQALNNGRWLWAHGNPGLGKTALMIRLVSDMLRDDPLLKCSFVYMHRWVRDQITGNNEYIYHSPVVLDDFDKFNMKNEYNIRRVLDLVELLKDQEARVLITSQYSLDYLLDLYKPTIDAWALFDRLRKQCHVMSKFKGESLR